MDDIMEELFEVTWVAWVIWEEWTALAQTGSHRGSRTSFYNSGFDNGFDGGFAGSSMNNNIETEMTISFDDAVFGCDKLISLQDPPFFCCAQEASRCIFQQVLPAVRLCGSRVRDVPQPVIC